MTAKELAGVTNTTPSGAGTTLGSLKRRRLVEKADKRWERIGDELAR
jgi:hypothetical protein